MQPLGNVVGEFETHITVALSTCEQIDALYAWATAHNLKCLHIVLDRGTTVSQPMLTRHGNGAYNDELTAASALADQLTADGFRAVRVKIEAAPDCQGVPRTDDEASSAVADRYFEHHVKLLLPLDADLQLLGLLALRHSAHLSRNALRSRSDGRQERFVTQRCYAVGRTTASARLQALLEELQSAGYQRLKLEEEFVIYDNNLDLDKGWLSS